MPAIITHHIFGEDVARSLPGDVISDEEELLAFLLGNQGPDPLFARFSTLPSCAARAHALAATIQAGRVTRAFMTLRDGVRHLPASDERVGRAFVLGLLGHYALDRAAHPFVISQQRALCSAEPSLERAAGEVHALIESDIDTWILWERCSATVEERPATGNLMRTERIERVGGALFSQMALAVFGVAVGVREYAACVRDYERLYRLIDPARSPLSRAAGTVERAARGRSRAEAMAHYVQRGNECPAANLECRPWVDPYSGHVRHESVADLYDEARLSYPALAEALVRGRESELRRLVGGLNYAGEPGTDE